MKHIGVCSVLIACCLTAAAWAERYGEKQPAEGEVPAPPIEGQIQAVPEDSYNPWQIYGYSNPADPSAVALYNAWPQVCTEGLWDNYCNEQHCHCYKGPKQHGGYCGGCNGCGCGYHHGHHKDIVPVNSVRRDCNNCGINIEMGTPTLAPEATIMEPTLQPQLVPEPPAEESSSASVIPGSNPIRKPFMPSNWRGIK